MFKLPLLLLLTATAHGAVGLNDHIIPLVHDGGGWSSQITVVNLSGKPANVIATFMTTTGFSPVWAVSVKSTTGKVAGNLIDLPLAPGTTAIIETSGTPAALTRGFVELIELGDQPIGAHATSSRRRGTAFCNASRSPSPRCMSAVPCYRSTSLTPQSRPNWSGSR